MLIEKDVLISGIDIKLFYRSSGHHMTNLYQTMDSLECKTPLIGEINFVKI